MIEADNLKFLTSEDYLKQSAMIIATIRDLLNDLEILTKVYVEDKHLVADEVAEYLRCTPTQIPRDIPGIKIGRNYLYKKSDVDKWILEHKKVRS